ncbi:putative membrane protein [Campylobacter blaseri]|nr:putative membrane protein [Campylobacter blaseri]
MKDLILRVAIIFIVIMAVYLTIPSKNLESLYMETKIFFGTICFCILVVLTISDFNK